jgi:hypothetical protein
MALGSSAGADLAKGARWPLERAVVLALEIICAVILPVLVLVFYVVRSGKARRFRLSAKVLKLLDISIEVDGPDEPRQLP